MSTKDVNRARQLLVKTMEKGRIPSGLEIIQNCLACPVREERLFCQLGPQALKELNAMRQTRACSKGAVLFIEGEPPRGLFILCSGRAKLIASFRGDRPLIVRIAGPGEVLGLSVVRSNAAHDVTAEAVELSQVSYIPQDDFLRFLQNHGEVSVRVAQQLSMELRDAHHQLARIALAPTVQARPCWPVARMGPQSPPPDRKWALLPTRPHPRGDRRTHRQFP